MDKSFNTNQQNIKSLMLMVKQKKEAASESGAASCLMALIMKEILI